MQRYEYRVIPAPSKGAKAKGVRGSEARFAHAMEVTLNKMAEEGWEYERAEFLPNEERSGLTGSSKTWRNLLVFRRAVEPPVHEVTEEPPVAEDTTPKPEDIAAAPETGQVIPLTTREGEG